MLLDLLSSGAVAYNQVGAFLGGFLCLAIGGVILGNGLYWRMKAMRVDATVTGVRQSGKFYYAVYSYMLPATGELIEATSDTGISEVQGSMATGKQLTLLVMPSDLHKVRPAGSILYILIAAIFLIPGVVFTGVALHSGPPTKMTFLFVVAIIAYLALKLKKIFIPKGQRKTLAEWRKENITDSREKITAAPLLHAEDIESTPVFKANAQRNAKNLRQGGPIMLVISVGLLFLTSYLAQKQQHLEAMGLRAPGRVVEMTLSSSNSSSTYYPVVRFADGTGAEHQFKGHTGSNPPSYHVGEDVTVLYLAEDAEHSAIIDSGWMNWLPSLICGGIGLLLLWGGLAARRAGDKAL